MGEKRSKKLDRRSFLKAAGFASLAGLWASATVGVLSKGEVKAYAVKPSDKALTAGRWGMVIDTRICKKHEPCEECIKACHHLHNVPHIPNKKHEIKWLWKEDFEHAFPDTAHEYAEEFLHEREFLVLCNHCEHPPCVRVCPTQATFKREDGIVMMDMHRCIGCRFCMAACPYGSRSFNWEDPRPYIKNPNPRYPTRMKGVVEKCIFCNERLAEGKLPACVEACKHGAIVVGDLTDPNSEINKILREHFTLRRKVHLGTGPSVFYII